MKVLLLMFNNGATYDDHREWPIGIFRVSARAEIDKAAAATLTKYHYYKDAWCPGIVVEIGEYNIDGLVG